MSKVSYGVLTSIGWVNEGSDGRIICTKDLGSNTISEHLANAICQNLRNMYPTGSFAFALCVVASKEG